MLACSHLTRAFLPRENEFSVSDCLIWGLRLSLSLDPEKTLLLSSPPSSLGGVGPSPSCKTSDSSSQGTAQEGKGGRRKKRKTLSLLSLLFPKPPDLLKNKNIPLQTDCICFVLFSFLRLVRFEILKEITTFKKLCTRERRPFVCCNNSFSNFDSPAAKQEAKGPVSKERREKGGRTSILLVFSLPSSPPLTFLLFRRVQKHQFSISSRGREEEGKEA